MEVIYILIPISVVLLVIAIGIFLWAVNSEQFEDLDTPAWRILRDEQERIERTKKVREAQEPTADEANPTDPTSGSLNDNANEDGNDR